MGLFLEGPTGGLVSVLVRESLARRLCFLLLKIMYMWDLLEMRARFYEKYPGSNPSVWFSTFSFLEFAGGEVAVLLFSFILLFYIIMSLTA